MELQTQRAAIQNLLLDYQHSEKLLTSAKVAAVEPDGVFEQNEKTIADVVLHKFTLENAKPTKNDLEKLRAIASQCPKIGGMAVYTARVFYGMHKDTVYNDDATCAAMGIAWRRAPGGALPQPSFSLQPNPADDMVFVNISQELKSETKLEVLDLLGKVVATYNYPVRAAGTWPLNTEELRAAMYFVRITDSNGAVLHTDKLVIVR